MSSLGLITKFSRRTLQPSVISLLTLQKRGRKARPSYDSSERILGRSASAFGLDDLEALKVSFHPASKHEVIPNINGTNYIMLTTLLANQIRIIYLLTNSITH